MDRHSAEDGGQRETASTQFSDGTPSRSARQTRLTSGSPESGPCRNTPTSGLGEGSGEVWAHRSR